MQYELGTFNTIPATEYDLSTGMILTVANLVHLQNLRASYGQEIVNLEIDINKIQEYAIALASLQTAVKTITYLMDCHNEAVFAQEQLAKEHISNQP